MMNLQELKVSIAYYGRLFETKMQLFTLHEYWKNSERKSTTVSRRPNGYLIHVTIDYIYQNFIL